MTRASFMNDFTMAWPFKTRPPTRDEQSLVRCCLVEDKDEASRLWAELTPLRKRLEQQEVLRSPQQRLLPLLRYGLRRHRIEIGPQADAVLRAATLWETRRAQRIAEIAGCVLDILEPLGKPPLLLDGAALAWRAYPEPWLRHCHDLDLLVPAERHDDAQALLLRAGALPDPGASGASTTRGFRWPGGLPVLLHGRLSGDDDGLTDRSVRARSVVAAIGARTAGFPDPRDCAVLLAAKLLDGRARDGISWVPDLFWLLRSSGGAALVRDASVLAGERIAEALGTMVQVLENGLGIDLQREPLAGAQGERA